MRFDSGAFDLRRGGLLARESSTFVGRTSELRALHEQLRSAERLVTLVGPRGIGKTRLALRYAGAYAQHWPGGVWFCDVRHASNVDEMTALVIATMGKDESARRREVDPSRAARALLVDARALLVVDNVEQLAPEVGEVLERWRNASPLLRILATSRAPIPVRARSSITLGALDTSASSRGRGDAVDLFMARVGADDPYMALERSAAGGLVAALGGVPFAIELAAFAARRDSPRALLEKVNASRAGAVDTSTAIARGFALLEDWARTLLLQASTFRGGFTLEAASAVLELPPSAPPIADALFALADKSLLELMRLEPLRFAMAESVRGHAADELRASSAWLACEWRHARYYGDVASRLLDHESFGMTGHAQQRTASSRASAGIPGAGPSAAELGLDRENFAALLAFGVKMDRPEIVLRAAIALDASSHGGGLSRRELEELDRALGRGATDDPELVERALGVRAGALFAIGSLTESIADAERALAMAERRNDRKQACAMRVLAAIGAFQAGALTRALDHLDAAQVIAHARGDRSMTVEILYRLGSVHLTLGNGALALEAWQRALALAVELCEGPGEARVSMGLGSYYLEAGDLAQAQRFYERGERLSRALEMHRAHRIVIAYQGIVCLEIGELGRAEALLRRAVIASRHAGDGRLEGFDEGFRAVALAALDRVDEARAAFASADALLEPHPFNAEVVRLLRSHLDLAEARAALAAGEWERAGWAIACARGRVGVARSPVGDEPALVERSDDARIALRLIDRKLAEIEAQIG